MDISSHQLAGMHYDSRTREVRPAKQRATGRLLSKQCGDLLLLFLNASDHTLTREEIRLQLWGHAYVSEDTINHAVCRLRKALAEIDGAPQAYIQTLPATGYRLHGCEEATLMRNVIVPHRRWLTLVSLFSLL